VGPPSQTGPPLLLLPLELLDELELLELELELLELELLELLLLELPELDELEELELEVLLLLPLLLELLLDLLPLELELDLLPLELELDLLPLELPEAWPLLEELLDAEPLELPEAVPLPLELELLVPELGEPPEPPEVVICPESGQPARSAIADNMGNGVARFSHGRDRRFMPAPQVVCTCGSHSPRLPMVPHVGPPSQPPRGIGTTPRQRMAYR
jgi:hypothetical protein